MAVPTRDYVRPMPATWWLKHPAYTKFIVRELSAVFIAAYCIFLLALLYQAAHADPPQWHTIIHEQLTHPLSMILHGVALFFALFNTIAFLSLTPRVVVMFRRDEKVPDVVIVALHSVLFVIATLGLIVLVKLALK